MEYNSVFPPVRIGTLPVSHPPLAPASVPLPPEPKGGHTRQGVRGWGSPNSDDWRKSLALCLLCPLLVNIGFYLLHREKKDKREGTRVGNMALLAVGENCGFLPLVEKGQTSFLILVA